MEAAEFFNRQPEPTPMVGKQEATEAEILQFPPRHGEGFLSKEGPLPYEIEIADWGKPKEDYDKDVGCIQTSVVTLSDNSRYVFRKTLPNEMHWETSVDYTLPLATRVTGYNTYFARKLAQSGMQSRIIGTNQSHKFSLLHDAQAALHILQYDDQEQSTALKGESVLTGYSMGMMKALGMLGLASHLDRSVQVTVGLDPCLAEKVDYAQEETEILDVLHYLGREVLEVGGILFKDLRSGPPLKALRRARHFISTMGVTPTYVRNTYDKWNVLASGETGNFPSRIPPEAAIIVHFFNGCRYNSRQQFKDQLAGHKNVRAVEEEGMHLSGASSKVVQRIVRKINLAQHMLAENVPASQIVDHLTTPVLRDI